MFLEMNGHGTIPGYHRLMQTRLLLSSKAQNAQLPFKQHVPFTLSFLCKEDTAHWIGPIVF